MVITVAIIGAGISGIAQAIRLEEQLGNDVEYTIYERGSDIGGVWRDSTWPGTAVDVPIHLYSLYSHLNPDFTSKWSSGEEVLAYWKHIASEHNLLEKIVFKTEFVSSHWNSASQQHDICLRNCDANDTFVIAAQVLISATGALNKPIIPKLPGVNTFKGMQWHSSRWNNQVDLSGKRVAIVGNGSSGIQSVPYISKLPGIDITQFIRSPGYFRPKVNFEYSRLQRWLFRWMPFYLRLYRWKLFFEYDTNVMSRGLGDWSTELRDKMTTNIVAYMSKKLPEKYHSTLIPDYPLHCKRVAYDAGWLESFHLPNVHLLATPIVSVEEAGLKTSDGKLHEFDIIVWATGFEVASTGVGLNHNVYGSDGQELAETWNRRQGAYGYLGVAVPRVPNYFAPLGPNAIAMSWGWTCGHNTEFIARIVKGMHTYDLSSVVVKDEVMNDFNEYLDERLGKIVFSLPACGLSWYKDPKTGRIVAPAPWNATELWTRTRKVIWEDWQAMRLPPGQDKPTVVDLRTETSWLPWHVVADKLAAGLRGWLEKRMTYQSQQPVLDKLVDTVVPQDHSTKSAGIVALPAYGKVTGWLCIVN